MRYTFALLLGLGVMLGAQAQAVPRLADATVLKNEAAAPDLKQNVWYRRGYYGYGYGYERPWFRHYAYRRPYWGGYYRPYWGGYYRSWGYGHRRCGYDD
jgi:hypothetical protein